MALPVLHLKNHDVNPDFRVISDGMWEAQGERIKALIGLNQYDAIVNACDVDEEGELKFQIRLSRLVWKVLRLDEWTCTTGAKRALCMSL